MNEKPHSLSLNLSPFKQKEEEKGERRERARKKAEGGLKRRGKR
jgi:hypothetical protein